MQLLACSSRSVGVGIPRRNLGRRELCFDGISSVCSPSQTTYVTPTEAVISLSTRNNPSIAGDCSKSAPKVIQRNVASTTRRTFIASLSVYPWYSLQAYALGDSSVTIEDVTPPVFTAGPLFPTEERIAELFEKNTYSVVNIFDVTLRPQLNVTGVVEIPEGNGSGVVWDEQGHIVTNYHVIGNSLSRNPNPGQVVARVNILTAEGVQKNFEGKLVGADRTKDLAVLKVEASEDLLKPVKWIE